MATVEPKERPVDPVPMAPHDLGGHDGYGPVPHSRNAAALHHDWERQVLSLMPAVTAHAAPRPGQFRYAIERLSPDDYFGNGYFGRWLAAMELLLTEHGLPVANGATQRAAGAPTEPPSHLPVVPDAPPFIRRDRPSFVRRQLATPTLFAVGDAVKTMVRCPSGHTRLPAYASDRPGTIASVLPAEVLPDSSALGFGERPQHTYSVAFDGAVLWGASSEPGVTVHVDLYECYLRPA